jgi:hypothetical protein
MDITLYDHIDPDTIYHNSDSKKTFFFLPWSNELLYDDDGHKTHEEMLQRDVEDDDDMVFDMVFPDKAKLSASYKKPFRTRKAALANTPALLGRFGILYKEMVIALWTPLTNPNTSKCVKKLQQVFPMLSKMEVVLVGADKKAQAIHPKSAHRAVAEPKPIKVAKHDGTYFIDGQKYTFDQLKELRLLLHSGTYRQKGQARSVLCHGDMDRYPELNSLKAFGCKGGSKPSNKPSRLTQRQKWQAFDPYAFKYGESFREFLKDKS